MVTPVERAVEIVGESRGIQRVRSTIDALVSRLATSAALPSILIEGETGTGKGLLARVMHRMSPRRDGPFVDLNCAAIPATLVESEMFGFEQGAFTDARRAKDGLFQTARGGTIFLDELGLLPEGAQRKLLKVLEERKVRRLGSTRSEPLDVWVIAATNEDLRAAVRERRFREDLYHRLAVVIIPLPSLRERGEDVLLLAEQFLARACRDYGLPPRSFSPDARAALLEHPWPGNVRELANVVERVALLSDSAVVAASELDLPASPRSESPRAKLPARPVAVRDDTPGTGERERLLEALEHEGGNVSRAATRLGLTRNAIRYRLEKHGLSGGPDRATPPSPPTAPAPFVPPPPAPPPPSPTIRWERRRVALLRIQLVDSDALSPRQTSRALELAVDKIQSFGGRVEELSAAAVLGAFGLEPTEDAPRRAANAALAVHKVLKRVQEGTADTPVAVAACLHVSLAVVARVREALEIDATLKRETSKLLDELAADARPDDIVVSAASARVLERGFELRPIGAVGIGPYRLVAHERGDTAPDGHRPSFVGRRRELEMLIELFDAADGGRGQLVGLTGEAGIGKSRLVLELRRRLADRSLFFLEGRCLSYTTAVAYSPILDVLRTIFDVGEGEATDSVRLKVSQCLRQLGLDGETSMTALLHLLGDSVADPAAWDSPEALKAAIFEMVRRVIVAASRLRPVLLVVEDMHWVDSTSRELLGSLAESVAGGRVLLVETYRPGYRPDWLERSYATQIALQPLSVTESRRLVESVVPSGWSDASVADLILARGDGNPFFLEELARALQEHEGTAAHSVPETVHDVLLARIDRLLPDDKLLLQTAAVIGRDVPASLLQAVSALPEEVRLAALARLRAGEFLHETSAGAEPTYTFRHALIHDVAYDSVPDAQRRSFHAQAAEAMERLYPTRLVEYAERLAEHAVRGGLWMKAVTYFRHAGMKALAVSSHRDAVHWFEQAAAALARLPATNETRALAIDLHLDARSALLPLGEFSRILEHLRAAERLGAALLDGRRLGRVCAYLTSYFRQVGDHEQALQAGQRGLAAAEVEGDAGILLTTNIYLGHVYYDTGQYSRAAAHFRRNVDAVGPEMFHERFGLPYLVSVHSRTWLAASLAELGQFADAVHHATEALRIAEGFNHSASLVSAHMGLGRAHLRQGDLDRARPVLERGVELARLWKMRLLLPFLTDGLGLAYALAGRPAEALPLLQEALDLHRAIRGAITQSTRLVSLAQGQLMAGNAAEALVLAGRAHDLADQHGERGYLAYAHATLAEASGALPPPARDAAEDHWRRAAALCEELEMRPLTARCHLGLGTLYRQLGRPEAADELDKAAALLDALAMPFWLARAEDLRRLR